MGYTPSTVQEGYTRFKAIFNICSSKGAHLALPEAGLVRKTPEFKQTKGVMGPHRKMSA